eukprot:1153760-Pelagomonas_calceolata.AAC.2
MCLVSPCMTDKSDSRPLPPSSLSVAPQFDLGFPTDAIDTVKKKEKKNYAGEEALPTSIKEKETH